jgi:hypothetical protein
VWMRTICQQSLSRLKATVVGAETCREQRARSSTASSARLIAGCYEWNVVGSGFRERIVFKPSYLTRPSHHKSSADRACIRRGSTLGSYSSSARYRLTA